eukprot:2506434-Alexandrium_andersonii.AAC.1
MTKHTMPTGSHRSTHLQRQRSQTQKRTDTGPPLPLAPASPQSTASTGPAVPRDRSPQAMDRG